MSLASAASFLAVPSAWDSGWAMYRVDGVRVSERRRGARHLTAPRRTLGQTCDPQRRAGELHDEVLRRVLQVADEDLTRLEALALQHGCRRGRPALQCAKIQREGLGLAPEGHSRGPALRCGLGKPVKSHSCCNSVLQASFLSFVESGTN